jgi:hypothetical protein
MPIFFSARKGKISAFDLSLLGLNLSALGLALVIGCTTDLTALAKDAATAATPKEGAAKNAAAASPAAANPAAATPDAMTKKAPSFADQPVGGKTTAELFKKFTAAYASKDDVAFLTLVKAPMRIRIRMHQQFRRDAKKPTANFKLETTDEEAARIRVPKADLIKPIKGSAGEESFELPVVGFIIYDIKSEGAPAGEKPSTVGLAIGKAKEGFFIIPRVPQNAAKSTATAPAAATSAPATSH